MCCVHAQVVLTPPAVWRSEWRRSGALKPRATGVSAKNALEFHDETTFRTPRAGRSPQNTGPGGSGELQWYPC